MDQRVVDDSASAHDGEADERNGGVLFFVHGFNDDQKIFLERHRDRELALGRNLRLSVLSSACQTNALAF